MFLRNGKYYGVEPIEDFWWYKYSKEAVASESTSVCDSYDFLKQFSNLYNAFTIKQWMLEQVVFSRE